MKKRIFDYYVADFETTTYDGQKRTDVWCAAIVKMYSENVEIFGSINSFFNYVFSLKKNSVIYFHNLKFDGNFILYYLLSELKMKQAYRMTDKEKKYGYFLPEKEMLNNTFKYSISDRGQWYSITIKKNNLIFEIRDSLKLLPFSVKEIGESFGTKRKKTSIEYTGVRYPNCPISDEEKSYIKNDVLVVSEALEILFNDGHNQLTIGSACLNEYKKLFFYNFDTFFPNLYEDFIDFTRYGDVSAGEFIVKSYKGGWCYLKRDKSMRVLKNGVTLDVNSLYPYVMHSMSGNAYPVGNPIWWEGNYIPDDAQRDDKYFFVKIRARFKIKDAHLPTIQIKGNALYKATEYLETSDIYNYKDKKYYKYYEDEDGIHKAIVELVLTQTDYYLFLDHYNVEDFEILCGCYFYTQIGLFDVYIDKYYQIKMNSKGAKRAESKLFLNNLYGKFASSLNSSFKYCEMFDDVLKFFPVLEYKKKPGYIAIGSAVTSYARNYTIRAAQKNYEYFCYSDTDSIHLDTPDIFKIKGVNIGDKELGMWKKEVEWKKAFFTRQKTYIEYDGDYIIKCAGMPEKCKELLKISFNGAENSEEVKEKYSEKRKDELNENDIEFCLTKRTLEDFKVGLKVPGKLAPKKISGGVVLVEIPYEMR